MAVLDFDSLWVVLGYLIGGVLGLRCVLKRANWLFYERKLGEKQYFLPPGDLGWPYLGTMWSFLRAFKSHNPDSFLDGFIKRFGHTGMYKTHMFGNPSIIVTTPDTCRKVLNDDDSFKPGWPISTVKLIGEKSFTSLPFEEHKRLRRLTSGPVNGHDALSMYIPYIEEMSKAALDKWSTMGTIELLTQLRKLTFRIIMYIFLSSESESMLEILEKDYTTLNYGVRAMAIDLPGFAYHKSLKARKKLVASFQSIVTERRKQRSLNLATKRKDMMDALLDVEDDNGTKLTDEEIIDVMLMYLNAGHESSGHTIMWTVIFLKQNPEAFRKAKEEQERIRKNMPPSQKGLTLKDYRNMEYLSKVIDETLRVITFSLTVFREATKDVTMNGYIIPKGWKVLVWFRSLHYDPKTFPNPMEFNPSRWDDLTMKAGSFLPFGAGSRLCPGNDLAKLEIGVFLHYFLLNYEMEQVNPKSAVMYLPHTRPVDNCKAIIRKRSSASA